MLEVKMGSKSKVFVLSLVSLGVLLGLGGCQPRIEEISGKLTVVNDTQPAELVLQDGTAVQAPPGSLPAGATITVRKVDPTKAPALPEGFSRAETLYEISADRSLQKPITLRFPMPKVADESVFQLCHYRNGQWEPVPFVAEDGFAVVQTNTLSIWGWLNTTADWIDEQIMKYADPDTYIRGFRDVTGLDKYMEIPLEGISDGISYDESEAKGLISASARIVEGSKLRLRVRNNTKFYLQVSFDSPAPIEPARGAYIDADTVLQFMRIAAPGSALVSDMLKEFLPKDVLLLPEGVAEFLTDYRAGEKLVITARWTDIAVIFSTLDPALGLVPIVDLEMVAAARDVLTEGSRFVQALPDLEKGWREHAMNLLNVVEAASRAGVLAGEKAFKSLASVLIVPFAVEYRKEYLEGRATDLLNKGADARAGGMITITYLAKATDRTPPAPTNFRATAASPTRIDLSWNPSTDNVGVAGYKIYRNGSFLRSVTTTSYSDTDLSPATRYCYRVSAYDAAGNESPRSNEVCASTLPQLPALGIVGTFTCRKAGSPQGQAEFGTLGLSDEGDRLELRADGTAYFLNPWPISPGILTGKWSLEGSKIVLTLDFLEELWGSLGPAPPINGEVQGNTMTLADGSVWIKEAPPPPGPEVTQVIGVYVCDKATKAEARFMYLIFEKGYVLKLAEGGVLELTNPKGGPTVTGEWGLEGERITLIFSLFGLLIRREGKAGQGTITLEDGSVWIWTGPVPSKGSP